MTFSLDQVVGPAKNKYPWLNSIMEAGFPNTKQEDFKYFPISLFPREFDTHSSTKTNLDIPAFLKTLPLNDEDFRLIMVNGEISAHNSSPELADAITINTGFSKNSLGIMPSYHWDYFKAIALYKGGQTISLNITPKSLLHQKHLQIVTINTLPKFLCTPKIEIKLAQSTKMSVGLFMTNTPEAIDSLSIPYIFTHLQPQAQLEFIQTLSMQENTIALPYIDVYQEGDSHLKSWTGCLSGEKSRVSLGSMLAGEQAQCDLKGFYLAAKKEQVEFYTRIYHRKPLTFSNQLFKGLATKGGRFSFNGDIIVDEYAKGVEAYQLSKNMVADKESKVYTRPQLHIAHHELKCTHGATVGGLNPNELFYLQSRGISLEQARHLSMVGFLDEVAETMPHLSTQKWAKQSISAKLGG